MKFPFVVSTALFALVSTISNIWVTTGSWYDVREPYEDQKNSGCAQFDFRPTVSGVGYSPGGTVVTEYSEGFMYFIFGKFDFTVYENDVVREAGVSTFTLNFFTGKLIESFDNRSIGVVRGNSGKEKPVVRRWSSKRGEPRK